MVDVAMSQVRDDQTEPVKSIVPEAILSAYFGIIAIFTPIALASHPSPPGNPQEFAILLLAVVNGTTRYSFYFLGYIWILGLIATSMGVDVTRILTEYFGKLYKIGPRKAFFIGLVLTLFILPISGIWLINDISFNAKLAFRIWWTQNWGIYLLSASLPLFVDEAVVWIRSRFGRKKDRKNARIDAAVREIDEVGFVVLIFSFSAIFPLARLTSTEGPSPPFYSIFLGTILASLCLAFTLFLIGQIEERRGSNRSKKQGATSIEGERNPSTGLRISVLAALLIGTTVLEPMLLIAAVHKDKTNTAWSAIEVAHQWWQRGWGFFSVTICLLILAETRRRIWRPRSRE